MSRDNELKMTGYTDGSGNYRSFSPRKYSGLGVDKERKISSRDKRDNRIQGVMDTGQSLAEES